MIGTRPMGAYNLAFCSGAAAGALLGTVATLVGGGGYPVAIVASALAPLAVLPYVRRSRSAPELLADRRALRAGASGN